MWQSVYRTVQQVLLKGLADGAQEVRLAAVSAMTLLVPYTRDSSETNLFKQLVPAALKVPDSQPRAAWTLVALATARLVVLLVLHAQHSYVPALSMQSSN